MKVALSREGESHAHFKEETRGRDQNRRTREDRAAGVTSQWRERCASQVKAGSAIASGDQEKLYRPPSSIQSGSPVTGSETELDPFGLGPQYSCRHFTKLMFVAVVSSWFILVAV